MTSERRKKLQKIVFTRDNFRCVKCGETSALTLDHIKPISEGGNDEAENLQTMCMGCNTKKGNFHKLSLMQRLKIIWNINDRLSSLKTAIRKETDESLNRKVGILYFDDRVKAIDTKMISYESRLSRAIQVPIVPVVPEINLRLTGLENSLSLIVREVQMLKDFLQVEYVPEQTKEVEEIKIVEVKEPAKFIKKKKSKSYVKRKML